MTELLFALKKIIATLLLPPAVLVLAGVIGLLLLRPAPRLARVLLWGMTIMLLLLSLPMTERGLMRGLFTPTLSEQQAQRAQAIVILGGGLKRATPESGDTLSTFALERARYGAVLAKQFHLPVLVTGGSVFGGRAEGEVLAEVLRHDFGVEVRWIENRALDTADNIVYSAEILRHEDINRVVLVTQDFHMPRALRECARQALECVGAPITSYSQSSESWMEELPNQGSFYRSVLALHEVLGMLAQSVY